MPLVLAPGLVTLLAPSACTVDCVKDPRPMSRSPLVGFRDRWSLRELDMA